MSEMKRGSLVLVAALSVLLSGQSLSAGSAGSGGSGGSGKQTQASGGSFRGEVMAALGTLGKGIGGVTVARLPVRQNATDIVLSVNGTTGLMPASNMKVVTTSAALATLGPDFKFRTNLLIKDSDLYLIGDGDPTLGDPDISEKSSWRYDTVFKQWAEQLKAKGVTSVRNVYVDDSIFDQKFVNDGWPGDQLNEKYVGQVAGLNFYFNTIDIIASAKSGGVGLSTLPPTSYVKLSNSVRAGAKNAVGAARAQGTNDVSVRGEIPSKGSEQFPVTIHDPAMYGATVLFETLRREGITMTGGVGRNVTARKAYESQPSSFVVAGSLETPIAVALARCNKDSANLYAECLAKRVGAKVSGQGSWESSAAAIGAFLGKVGVASDQYNLTDGCGLARDDRVTSEMMVKVLAYDFSAPYRDVMMDSLAVGGVDGTLGKRFGGALAGRVHAKSGYIKGVYCLSGYLEAKNGQWYAFSVLLNGMAGSGKPVHERVVGAIDQYLP